MIHIVGDSHTQIFNDLPSFTIYWLPTITASHVSHRLTEIYSVVEHIPKDELVMFSMGEIDCRVFLETKVEYYKSLTDSKNTIEIIESVVNRYFNVIKNNFSETHRIGFWGPVASYTHKVSSSKELGYHPDMSFFMPGTYSCSERNELTKIFNDRLKVLCDENGFVFMTMFYDMIDENMNTKENMTDGIHLPGSLQPFIIEKFKEKGLL
jgi:hypothetical protein